MGIKPGLLLQLRFGLHSIGYVVNLVQGSIPVSHVREEGRHSVSGRVEEKVEIAPRQRHSLGDSRVSCLTWPF